MTQRQLKLGLVPTGVGGPGQTNRWRNPEIPIDASVSIDWYIELVRQAEAAKFDFVFIVDSQFITPDSPPHYLNRLEPLTLLSALAVTTSHIGLVGTLTTSYNAPFNLARRLASLDLISKGRAGWNVVTSGDAGTAGNYSRDEHFDYDTRYGRAFEYLDVVRGLWRSYEDDAIVGDRASGVFLDKSKLHALDHKGEHFQVVGPLNIQRSPQGEPVIFQAGDSDQGRDLGASVADAIFTHAKTLAQGQAFYADLKARAAARGRNPDELIILPGFTITVGDTDDDAREIEREQRRLDQSFDQALAEFGRAFGWHDFRQYNLDAPFPAEALAYAASSFFTQAQRITQLAQERGLTLRQTVEHARDQFTSPSLDQRRLSPARLRVGSSVVLWMASTSMSGIPISSAASQAKLSHCCRRAACSAPITNIPLCAKILGFRSRETCERGQDARNPAHGRSPADRRFAFRHGAGARTMLQGWSINGRILFRSRRAELFSTLQLVYRAF